MKCHYEMFGKNNQPSGPLQVQELGLTVQNGVIQQDGQVVSLQSETGATILQALPAADHEEVIAQEQV